MPASDAENVTIVNPKVQLLGASAAVICYVRLNQKIDKLVILDLSPVDLALMFCVEKTLCHSGWPHFRGRLAHIEVS